MELIYADLVGYDYEGKNTMIKISDSHDAPIGGCDVAEVYGHTEHNDPIDGVKELRDLFVAAPDLLAAAEDLMNTLNRTRTTGGSFPMETSYRESEDVDRYLSDELEALEAAITKAKNNG
tara:strand:- start:191 stop:550 length:360 start_codon:yes stop_codon:yes gene_type:complete